MAILLLQVFANVFVAIKIAGFEAEDDMHCRLQGSTDSMEGFFFLSINLRLLL